MKQTMAEAAHDRLLTGLPADHFLRNTTHDELRNVAEAGGTLHVPQVEAALRRKEKEERHARRSDT